MSRGSCKSRAVPCCMTALPSGRAKIQAGGPSLDRLFLSTCDRVSSWAVRQVAFPLSLQHLHWASALGWIKLLHLVQGSRLPRSGGEQLVGKGSVEKNVGMIAFHTTFCVPCKKCKPNSCLSCLAPLCLEHMTYVPCFRSFWTAVVGSGSKGEVSRNV